MSKNFMQYLLLKMIVPVIITRQQSSLPLIYTVQGSQTIENNLLKAQQRQLQPKVIGKPTRTIPYKFLERAI